MQQSKADAALVARLASLELRVFTQGDTRAPNKPLLLLFALGRLQQGAPRLVRYSEAHEPVRDLLDRFGLPRKTQHPEYAFFHLTSDGIWDVPGYSVVPKSRSPTAGQLRDADAHGGFPEDLDSFLRRRPDVVRKLAEDVLAAHFPESYRDEIAAAVGLDLTGSMERQRAARDPSFRLAVLTAYEHRCAVCGLDARLDGRTTLLLEAAHVKWHCARGPSSEENGLAMCSLHHRALDLGILGISQDRRVRVTERLVGGDEVQHSLVRFHGTSLRVPIAGHLVVADESIRWHTEQVFKGPVRRI